MYEQAILSVENPQSFGIVHAAIASAFSSALVDGFLQSLQRSHVRVRDFEAVLSQKALSEQAVAEYRRLGGSDQGQIREFYLASLERVEPDLRQKFFKLYAYY